MKILNLSNGGAIRADLVGSIDIEQLSELYTGPGWYILVRGTPEFGNRVTRIKQPSKETAQEVARALCDYWEKALSESKSEEEK